MLYSYSNKTEVLNSDNAKGYLLAATENNDIVELYINENGLVPTHTLPIDVTFYVISGNGQIKLSKEAIRVTIGDIVDVKGGMERSWQNISAEPLKLLVIKKKE